MFSDLPDLLGPYLLPLLIAVPLALVVFLISTRRGDERDEGPLHRDAAQPPAAPAATTPQPAPSTLSVPSAPLAPAAPIAPPEHPAPTPAPVAVLLVDDSAVARAKLGKLFEAAGYRVTLAKDGLEALERLAEQHFSVMVTDLEMPNKDGFELIADVLGSMATEDLPIIAITGHDEMQARVHQVQGLYGIFKKPWNDRELLKRVETLATLRPAPRQA